MSAASDHVAGLVRAADPDSFLAALYAPEDKRRALLAIAAFSAEIASIRDRVSEPMPGEIRLQWWRDALAAPENGDAAGHPVLSELREAVRGFGLPPASLQNCLDARVFDLYDDPMPSRSDLEGYAGETDSALIQLSAMVLDAGTMRGASEAAGHGGCARTIVGCLINLPRHRARGQCFAPLDLLAAAGSSRDEWVRGAASEANRRAADAMVALAREHLGKFSAAAKALPPALRPAFLPLAVVPAQLRAIAKRGVLGEQERVSISALRRHWLVFRRATGGWR